MTEIRKVEVLPVVDTSVMPELPESFEDKNYVVFGSKWNHAEEEHIAALVLTAAARRGKWEPIPWTDMVNLLEGDFMRMMTLGSNVGYYLHQVADSGDIELVEMNEEHYIIPTQVLAETLKGCQIRYYESTPLPETPEAEDQSISDPRPDNAVVRLWRWLFN